MNRRVRPQIRVIPALPGWLLVQVFGDPIIKLFKQPIVAWAVTTDWNSHGEPFSWAEPVCVESLGEEWVIQTPDGQFIDPENCFWDDEASVVEYFTERLKQRKARDVHH